MSFVAQSIGMEYLDQYLPYSDANCAKNQAGVRVILNIQSAGRLKNIIQVGGQVASFFMLQSEQDLSNFQLSWYTMKVNLNKEIKMNNLQTVQKCNS